jgi:D-alanine-D-alanine ligase
MIQNPSRPARRDAPLRVLYACNLRPDHCDDESFYEWEDPQDARAVMDAMRAAGCVVEPYQVSASIAADLARHARDFDIVFNNVETVPGLELGVGSRESILPFHCASLGLPFTGSTFLTLTVTMDKRVTKGVAMAAGVPTPRTFRDTGLKLSPVRYPCIVKPAAEGSSMGIDDLSVAHGPRELRAAVDRVRASYDDAWMIEEFVRGPELAMGVIGSYVLDPVAVDLRGLPGEPLVRSHVVKHGEIHHVERAELPPARLDELKQLTWRLHAALGARHYNRMEFIDDGRRFWLIEVNPLPDISATESFLAVGAGFWGIDFPTMINLVLWSAVEEYRRRPEHAERFAEHRIAPLRRCLEPGLAALAAHPESWGPVLAAGRRARAAAAGAASGGRNGHRAAGHGNGRLAASTARAAALARHD